MYMNKAVNLLQQYISNGQLDKALIECKKFCDQNPSDLYLKKLLSHVYYLKENFRYCFKKTFDYKNSTPK